MTKTIIATNFYCDRKHFFILIFLIKHFIYHIFYKIRIVFLLFFNVFSETCKYQNIYFNSLKEVIITALKNKRLYLKSVSFKQIKMCLKSIFIWF